MTLLRAGTSFCTNKKKAQQAKVSRYTRRDKKTITKFFTMTHTCDGDDKIEVFVRLLTGRTVLLEMKRGETVDMIFKRLAKEAGLGLPLHLQCLHFLGRELDKAATLAANGVETEATLHLALRAGISNRMPIHIKTMTGKAITIEVRRTDTIGHVKEQITRRTGSVSRIKTQQIGRIKGQIIFIEPGIGLKRQLLTFNGQQLDDEMTLAHYGRLRS
eukprot:g64628.t1